MLSRPLPRPMLVHHTEECTMITNHTARRRSPRQTPQPPVDPPGVRSPLAEAFPLFATDRAVDDTPAVRRVPRMLTVQVMLNGTESPRLAAKMGLAIASGEVELVGLPAEGRTRRFAGDRLFLFVEYDDDPEEGR